MKKLILVTVTLFLLAACQPEQLDEPTVPVEEPGAAPSGATAGEVQANGITIACESFGSPEDESILLIAGTGQQLTGWPMTLVDALVSQGYRVIRFDNRDVGRSTKLSSAGLPDAGAIGQALQEGKTPPVPYTLRDMAADALGLLDALGIEQAHIVGISMGGAIAQYLAIDYPERVLSLTSIAADSGNPALPPLADPATFAAVPPQPTTVDREAFVAWQVAISQALAGAVYPTDEATLRAWAERDFDRGFDPDGLIRQQTASLAGHFENPPFRLEHLQDIQAPTVVVQGTEDPIVPVASAEDIVARIPNAELRLIEGLGHFLPEQLIPEMVDAILAAATGAVQPVPPDALRGTRWQLVSFGPTDAPAAAGAAITLEFGAGGQAGGHGGCNDYGGSYTVREGSLRFAEIVSTLKACDDEAVNDQEALYLEALRTTGRFTLTGDSLTIWYGGDDEMLSFVPLGTAAPQPTGSPPAGKSGERIRFPADGNHVEIFAELAAGATDTYLLPAERGEILAVEITSPHNDVRLAVAGADGISLKAAENGPPSWAGALPASQDYALQAVSVGQATAYTLRIWLEPPAPETQERISLEGEETTVTRSGALPAGGVTEYVVSASAGQTLHVQTVGYHAPVGITVTGPDGQSWSGEQGPSDVYIFVAQVELPEDGDYSVTLSLPEDAGATRFDVAFTLIPGAAPHSGLPAEPPERVEVEPGTSPVLLSGLLPSNRSLKQFVLSATAGQAMTVTLDSGAVPVSLILQEPGGAARFPEAFPEEGRFVITHTFALSETGDYLITLDKAEQTPSTAYELGITIR